MKNMGKIFEQDFKNSVPDYCYLHRLKDTAQSYNNNRRTKFTWQNPCDFFLFSSKSHLFFAIECKSTKYKSMAVQFSNDEPEKMIKFHQLKSLKELSQYDGIHAGFLLNFRDEEKKIQRTYYIGIENFVKMMKVINKKSFNEMDLLLNGAIKVDGKLKRTRYIWNINILLDELSEV